MCDCYVIIITMLYLTILNYKIVDHEKNIFNLLYSNVTKILFNNQENLILFSKNYLIIALIIMTVRNDL